MTEATPILRPIPRTASEWVVRLNANDCSPEDQARFEQWLAASPENRVAYESRAQLWRFPAALTSDAEMLADLARLTPSPRVPAESPRMLPANATIRSLQFRRTAWALAVSLATLVVAGALLFQRPAPVQVATGATEQRTLRLPDGSTVTLSFSIEASEDPASIRLHIR